MTALWVVLAGLGAFVVGLVGAVVGDLLSEEVRDRLDELPEWLLRLAAQRLPADLREDRLAEWRGELHQFLRGAEARPVTRLVRGVRYATGLLHVASRIGRAVATIPRPTRRHQVASSVQASWSRATKLASDSAKALAGVRLNVALFVFVSACNAVAVTVVALEIASSGLTVHGAFVAAGILGVAVGSTVTGLVIIRTGRAERRQR